MRKVKTLLINPPVYTEALYGKFARSGSDLPPLSLCYIASYLLKYGKEVAILDTAKLRLSISEIKKQIYNYQPDIVGFYTATPYIDSVKIIAKEISSSNSNILIIAGGPHFVGDTLNDIENSNLDIIVVGEGEVTLLEIVEGLENKTKVDLLQNHAQHIHGIVYKRNGTVKYNPARKLIKDIDTIPIPARHLLPPLHTYKVSAAQYKRKPSTGVLTARGCPFRCIFCVCSVSKQKVRTHSVEYVMTEIDELIQQYGMKDVTFIDDVFTLSKKRTYMLCDELMKRKKKLTWSANVRIGLVDKDMLKYMKDAGCWMVLAGVESGNQKIIDRIKKQIKLEQAEQLSRWCKEIGLMFHPNFIIGHPGETIDTINQTINFAMKLYSHFPLFAIMTPYPGTELWNKAEEYGTLNKNSFENYSLGSDEPCFIPYGLTKELLVKKRNEAYRKCYLNCSMVMRHLIAIKNIDDVKRLFDAMQILTNI